jgi:hypothetical protein
VHFDHAPDASYEYAGDTRDVNSDIIGWGLGTCYRPGQVSQCT